MGLIGHSSSAAEEERERREQDEFLERISARLGFIKENTDANTAYNSNLLIVGAHLTQVCHPNGGTSKEIVGTYKEIMRDLIDWFNVVPLREKLEDILEESVWSKWSVKEQPVIPTYTPKLNRRRRGNSKKVFQDSETKAP
ncbi:MAG: hypothetical protein SVY53_11145 [Chloroflexota bacterium]|nr:hypothetical protein [Chloroflexota bacterium]